MRIVEKIKKFMSDLKDRLKKAVAYVKERLKKAVSYLKGMKRKHIIIGALVLLVVAGVSYAAVSYFQITDPERILLNNDFLGEMEYRVDEEFSENIVNIAILGFDRNAEREEYSLLFLPDFIAVLSIDFETNDMAFVRVLRDSYVPIAVTGIKDKINHSYYHGYMHGTGKDRDANGLKSTLDTVSTVLGGVPIHYYVSVNMDGLAYIVDAIGGIDYKVKENLYDKYGNRVLSKGTRYFDGEAFVLFVRHRDDNSGQDIGRAARQFDIMYELFKSVRNKGLLKNIPSLFKVYRDYIVTNLSLKQVAALAYFAKDFDPSKEMFFNLDGTNQSKDGIWYWVLNQAQRVRLIREVFGITATAWPQEVLTDTPPPPLKLFDYTLRLDAFGKPSVALSWEPGDAKKVTYELYRDGELIAELEATTYYTDTDVLMGKTYNYHLVVKHYRAVGPPGNLIVRVSPPLVAVPVIAGMTLDQAKTAIEGALLVFGGAVGEREFSETVAEGRVIRAVPAAGTMVEQGSIVSVVLSRGPAIIVPDVVRIPQGEAQGLIVNAGLIVGNISQQYDETIPEGNVISQNPGAREQRPPGTAVNLVISRGPESP